MHLLKLIFVFLPIVSIGLGMNAQDTYSVRLGIPEWVDTEEIDEEYSLHSYDLNVFVEYHPVSFNSYRNQLQEFNIDMLNSAGFFFGINFNYHYRNHIIGIDLGFAKETDDYRDSLHLGLNGLMTGLTYGYTIINREKWEFSPMVSARWFRYRLMNSNIDYDLDLITHLEDRDLDLRFNQAVGSLGGKINFKLPHYQDGIHHVNLTVYGGYQFKLHQKTLLFSRRNRLDAGGATVKYDGWFIGMGFGYRF